MRTCLVCMCGGRGHKSVRARMLGSASVCLGTYVCLCKCAGFCPGRGYSQCWKEAGRRSWDGCQRHCHMNKSRLHHKSYSDHTTTPLRPLLPTIPNSIPTIHSTTPRSSFSLHRSRFHTEARARRHRYDQRKVNNSMPWPSTSGTAIKQYNVINESMQIQITQMHV